MVVGAKASFLSVKLGPEKELREQPLSLRVIVLLLMAGLESILIIFQRTMARVCGLVPKRETKDNNETEPRVLYLSAVGTRK